MTDEPVFTRMRVDAFRDWCSTVAIPGISREVFRGIFAYLLSHQEKVGDWDGEGRHWEVVQTAVILKSLAALGFRKDDSWRFELNGSMVEGSVRAALAYLAKELEDKSTERVGEDIWDACQALLAVAAFGSKDLGIRHAQNIARDWRKLYEDSLSEIKWSGPAYLAAMVDVLLRYAKDLGDDFDFREIAEALAKCELVSGGAPTGLYQAHVSARNMDRWTTSLVLLTLCSLPSPDVQAIERSVLWLLSQSTLKGWEEDPGESPMYVGRVLHSLWDARRFVAPQTRGNIDTLILRWNKRLASYWNEKASLRTGSLKSYIAASEYLAALTVEVPAGLIFDLPRPEPSRPGTTATQQNTPGGIFIVHGRDMATVRELQFYIQNTLNLGNPVVLRDQASLGATVIEKFERDAKDAKLVFILMTPDDVGALAGAADPARRARQNVIFEMGYFVGVLGRRSGRIVLLSKGDIELPSDLGGVLHVDISDGIEAHGEEIRRELKPILETNQL